MSNSSDPNRKMVPRSGGFFTDVANRFRLVGRLMGDQRVNPLLKLLPIGTLVYLVVPDLVPFIADDAVIMWLGTSLFVELCPPQVVEEHLQIINGILPGTNNSTNTPPSDVVDGEFHEIDPNRSSRP